MYLVLVPTLRDVHHTRIVHDRVQVVVSTGSDCVTMVCAVKTAVHILVPEVDALLSRIVVWCETKTVPGLQSRVDGTVAELVHCQFRVRGDELCGFGVALEVLAIEVGVMEAWSMVSAETSFLGKPLTIRALVLMCKAQDMTNLVCSKPVV